MLKRCAALVLIGSGLLLTGCLERRMTITSEPPGATVTVNDVELGRTPVSASFVYYGTYDVQLELKGFEPLRTKAKASAPLHEYPPVDLAVTALPADVSTEIKWHFTLVPEFSRTQSREELEKGLMQRAGALRGGVK